MPNWSELLSEIKKQEQNNPQILDELRRKYLADAWSLTKRNVIAYYSGWLQRPENPSVNINDKDKNAFMLNIHKMDRSKGLDLILHTPGGDLAATESIVDYLHSMFGNDVRAIVPQICMSGGTMIAMSCKSIVMGKHSNLGPIDPQMGGVACQGVLDEFKKAKDDIRANPQSAPLWQAIISKYHPTFLGACANAIMWSEELAESWLARNMCSNDKARTKKILNDFSDHSTNKSHARHISKDKCREIGLNIEELESDQKMQEVFLTIHHCYMITFQRTAATKIVENQFGVAYVENAPQSVPTFPLGLRQNPSKR